jgi:dTDP-4-amino-4,6-dideoxygalactose transaminase
LQACITAHQLPVAKSGRALACILCASPLSTAAAVADVERVRLVLQQTRELAGRYRQSVNNDPERIRVEVERGQGRAMRMLAATLESMQHAREEMIRELDRLREPTIYCCAILHYVTVSQLFSFCIFMLLFMV